MAVFRLLLALLVLAAPPFAASAQDAGSRARAEAQRLAESARSESDRGNHQAALSYYVRAISLHPNDVGILQAAGSEALAIGDADAAFGFLGRAVTISPRDPSARAAYGRALIHAERPKDALMLFDQAVRLGMAEARVAGDRGLARDLLGESRRAQRDYRLALAADPDNALLVERLGLSLAISGDRSAAIAMIQPLMRSGRSNASRALAFIHALSGDVASARKVAMAQMSASQADAYTPFFARIALLDSEEKAAAVHLGRLPQVRLARKQVDVPKRVKKQNSDPSALRSAAIGDKAPVIVDKPEPLGAVAEAAAPDERTAKPKAAPAAKPSEALAAAAPVDECGQLSGRQKTRCTANARALERRCAANTRRPTAECVAYAARRAEAEAKPEKAKPETGKAVASPFPLDRCAELSGGKRVQCQADARALERRCGGSSPPNTAECKAYASRAAEPKPKRDDARPRARANSSERHWVQVASGRNKGDLPKEWARLKKASTLLAKRTPHTVPVGASNRLLVGPFDSAPEAHDLVNRLSAAGLSSFPWTSAAGEDVDRLAIK